MDTDALLAERGKTHGDYNEHADATQSMKHLFRQYRNWSKLSYAQKETLEMIAHKIGRALTGDPDHIDHWDDIAGYAKLVSNILREREAKAKAAAARGNSARPGGQARPGQPRSYGNDNRGAGHARVGVRGRFKD